MSINNVYYGEKFCSLCKGVKMNKAYYKINDCLVCGVHSRNKVREEENKS